MSNRRLALSSVIFGGITALFGAFPVAALIALVFRFPIPFHEISSGPQAVLPSLFAVLFYGLGGGFILLAVLGAPGGLLAYRIGRPDGKHTFLLTTAFALLTDVLMALALAVFLRF